MTTSILATWEEPSSTLAADSVTLLSNLNGQFLSISSIGVQQTSSLFLVYQSVPILILKKNKLKKKTWKDLCMWTSHICKNPTSKWLAFRNIKLWVHDIPNSSSTLFAFPLSGCLPFFFPPHRSSTTAPTTCYSTIILRQWTSTLYPSPLCLHDSSLSSQGPIDNSRVRCGAESLPHVLPLLPS